MAGAGFGGLYSALRLSALARPSPHAPPAIDITLVDRSNRFVFLPLLYELAVGDAGMDEVAPTFRSLLASTGIQFVQGEVDAIDTTGKTVTLTAAKGEEMGGSSSSSSDPAAQQQQVGVPRTLTYDKLVLALGSEPVLPPASTGEATTNPHAMPFYRLEDADELKRRLQQVDARPGRSLFRTVIVGGGYSGVELAANLAARLGRDKGAVTLVDRGMKILGASPDHVRASANKRLEEEGVEVLLGVDVLEVGADKVVVRDRAQASVNAVGGGEGTTAQDKEEENIVLAADLVVWTAGARVSHVVRALEGLDKDASGKVLTDKGLRAQGTAAQGDVYVLGDNAAVEGYRGSAEGGGAPGLPSTAQVAFQESEVAAWNIWSALTPSAPGPLVFQYTPLGEMLTLGPMDGAISGLTGLLQLEGPSASLARRLVYVMRMPTGSQRLKAAKSWAQGRVDKLKGSVQGALAGGKPGGGAAR